MARRESKRGDYAIDSRCLFQPRPFMNAAA
jgi:hypothetical protein